MEVFPSMMPRVEPRELEENGTVCYQEGRKSGKIFMGSTFSGYWKRRWGVEGLSVLRRGVWAWGLGSLELPPYFSPKRIQIMIMKIFPVCTILSLPPALTTTIR